MKTVEIQERQLNYLLSKANLTMEKLQAHFDSVDNAMSLIEVGSMVYEPDEFGSDYFPKEVTKIIDKEQGIIETYESSINRTEISCITHYCTLSYITVIPE